jgi:hypothetical protein
MESNDDLKSTAEGKTMSAVQRIALTSLIFGFHVAAALADGPPKLDVSITRKASTRLTGRDTEGCLLDEGVGQRTLAKNWSKYRAGDKTHCVTHVQKGGVPSYVELLSCLETLRDAKDLRDGDGIMVEADQSKQPNSRPVERGPDGLALTEEPPPPAQGGASPARPCPDAPAAFAALPPAVAGWLCLRMRP